MRLVLAGLMSFSLCGVGLAQTTVPYTFTAGTPALATEVNANFQALVTAINKLEGQITATDIVGTYAVAGLQTGLHALTNNGGIEVISWSGTVTFAANGTFTSAWENDKHSLWWSVFNPNAGLSATLVPQVTNSSATENFSGTWSLAGGTVTFSLPASGSSPSSFPFQAVSGGRLLIGSAYNNLDASNVLLLFTRIN